ncbi:hypothetical protein [Achromobacter deleyi]|uniref:hypothetical protein n=1 Tax=Achromobacter deleyi TaxID=1353891 RepID=UPI0014652D49|nr:hypothetical protein [Achromobacter deleyi]CAB3820935.1 hypothetical protein LMG3412_00250 [Achromobacter deleyi]
MKKILSAALLCGALSGCASLVAPTYQASMDNVTALKKGEPFSAKVGEVKSEKQKGNANPISLRGARLRSPYDNSYGGYLAEALKQELSLANRYSDSADVEISGVLLQNNLDAGLATGIGKIEARFIVTKAGQIKYDQIKSAQTEWSSAFAAMVALPKAVEEYQPLVAKLLNNLFSDQSFLNALK